MNAISDNCLLSSLAVSVFDATFRGIVTILLPFKKRPMRKDEESINLGRRNFIFIATGMVVAGGTAAALVPLIGHLAPSIENRYKNIDVDLSQIDQGQQVRIVVSGKPIIIRHRAQWEIDLAQADDHAKLRYPEKDIDRIRPGFDGKKDPRYLIISAICPHFGGLVTGEQDNPNPHGRYKGWYCYAHGADFDTSGRSRRGPAPGNLHVPDFEYIADNVVRFRGINR